MTLVGRDAPLVEGVQEIQAAAYDGFHVMGANTVMVCAPQEKG